MTGDERGPHRRVHRRRRRRPPAISVFDTVDVGVAPAAHRRPPRRALRRNASSRATPRASRRPTSRRTTRSSAARSACSTSSPTRATSTSPYGTTKTPPGTANFTLSSQPNNQNNPNVDPQISTNLEVGSKWDFYGSRLSLTGAAFRTEERERHLHGRRDGGAADLQPGRRAAGHGRRASASPGGSSDSWDVTANFAYLDSENLSQNLANAGKRLTLTPEFSGSVWTTYTTPIRLSVGGGVRFTDAVYVNAANTIKAPGYQIVDAMATYARAPPGVAAAQRLQRDRRDLHPQHQQQRRPLQPGPPAHGRAHGELRVREARRDADRDPRRPHPRAGRARAADARCGGLGRRPGHRRAAVGARQGQPAARRDPIRSRASSAT